MAKTTMLRHLKIHDKWSRLCLRLCGVRETYVAHFVQRDEEKSELAGTL